MNLDELFRESVARAPEKLAIIQDQRELTYADLQEAIDRASSQLADAGIRQGNCVGLHVTSGLEYIVQTYAVWRLGACIVPIPIELADVEKSTILREIHLDFVINSQPDAAFIGDDAADGEISIVTVRNSRAAPERFSTINAAFIRFTSGTTGTAKGVVLSHETIAERISAANDALRLNSDDRVVWLLSMSYHFAVSIVAYLNYGATILMPKNLFADAILGMIEQRHATFVYGSPLQYSWMVSNKGNYDTSSLRLAVSTTAPLRLSLAQKFLEKFGIPLTQALGIIEVGLPCINVDFARSQPTAVGRVGNDYELKLRDSDFSDDCQEILLRGPGILDAYYEPWRERADIMQDGWFATGDMCNIDEQGCITIQGRSKDLINISGMKFFPQEAESVLCDHPDVKKARVFSVDNERWGEQAYAEIVLAQGLPDANLQELTTWCQERLAPFKVPAEFRVVEKIRMTASGKVLH